MLTSSQNFSDSLINGLVGNVATFSNIGYDAFGRTRVSQMTTLFDGKLLNEYDSYLFNNRGTGTGTFVDNKYQMSVTTGQYFINQSIKYSPYFSGKSQFIELTTRNFHTQNGIIKRMEYFSSAATAPYDTLFDGIFIEDDGTGKRLKAYRNGTQTINVAFENMTNYEYIKDHNWQNFNVIAFDFLWLGGAILRFHVKTAVGFITIHTVHYASQNSDIFILSPNQPIRYEIRSTGGVGSLDYVCSTVTTEGSINESGYDIAVSSILTAAIPSNTIATIGTTYPLIAVKLKPTYRNKTLKLIGAAISVTSNADVLRWNLHLNPTFSGALSYTNVNNSCISYAEGNNAAAVISNTITAPGRVLAAGYISQNQQIPSNVFEEDYYSALGVDLDNNSQVLCLSATPISGGITLNSTLNLKEY